MSDIKWPKGKTMNTLRAQVRKHCDAILNGTMLAVDPASGGSSLPGYAVFNKGRFVEGGTIKLRRSDDINKRLQQLLTQLQETYGDTDVLAVEKIRGGRTHIYLPWAVGVTIAGVGADVLIEVPVIAWRAIIPKDYVKSDAADAAMIGQVLIAIAREETK